MDDYPHGTHKRFLIQGCRCTECVAAYVRYKDENPDGPKHVRDDFLRLIEREYHRQIVLREHEKDVREAEQDRILRKLGIRV